jgi:hypothetical protein
MAGLSLVTDYGEHGSSCGYCRSTAPTSVSHGMMVDTLTVDCYQELLDRCVGGWLDEGESGRVQAYMTCSRAEQCSAGVAAGGGRPLGAAAALCPCQASVH